MSNRRIFLDVVNDQESVTRGQMIPAQGLQPEVLGEDRHLQREIEQVVLETESTESHCTCLRLVVDQSLSLLPHPGTLEARGYLCGSEPNDSRLVEVIEDLAVETVAVDGDRLEVALAFN